MPILKTINLEKIYKRGGGSEVHALRDVNLEIEKGSLLSIMGPSGSGKSTLLNMLGLLDKPTSGEIYMDGREVCCLGKSERTRIRREQIGFVFQNFNLIPTLTAIENVMLPLRYTKIEGRKERAEEVLGLVDMSHRKGFKTNELSGGEQQRAAIARALVLKPAIILADEPTGELDSKNGAAVMQLMKELNRTENQTFIVVTHDPRIASQTERTLNMVDGAIVQEAAVS